MKYSYLIVTALLFLLTLQLKAQAPNQLNYQGVARDASGVVLPNQNISLRFTIHQGSATGATVYQETKAATTNQLGLFTVAIGSGVVVSGTFATITWATNTYYLQVEMDPTGGNTYLNMGTNQFLSVPYALNAATSSSGWNLTGNTSTTAGTNFIGTTDAKDFVLKTNNTERMRIASAGNIGINTTSPLAFLDINGGANGGGNDPVTNNFPGPGAIAFEFSGGGGYRHFIQSRHDNTSSSTNNALDFYINSGVGGGTASTAPGVGNFQVMSIVNGYGNPRVGIGTKAPGYSLDVVGSINFSQELLVGGSAGTAGYVLQSNGAASPPSWVTASGGGGGWSLTGNSATTPGTNFIGTTDAKDFVTKTNGIERMRITSAGNVGINAASPIASSGLDIQYGDNNSSSSGSNPTSPVADIALQFYTGGYRHYIASRHDNGSSTGGNAIDFYINSGSSAASSAPGTGNVGAFTIENYNGTPRVGVGTIVRGTNYLTGPITDNSTVNAMFEVHAPTGNSDITLSTIDASAANVGGLIEFRGTGRGVTSGGNERLGQIENVYTGTSGLASRMTFYTNNGTTYTRAMDISNAQNVGIGVPAPTQRLDVSGNVQFTKALMPNADAGAVGSVLVSQGPNTPPIWSTLAAVDSVGDNWGTQTALTDSAYTGGTYNTITGNGTGSAPLKLAKQGATTGQVLQWSGSSWAPATISVSSAWNITGNSGTIAGTNFIGTTDAKDFVLKTTNTERLRIASGGNIGINSPSPAAFLDISGGANNAGGNVTTGLFPGPADIAFEFSGSAGGGYKHFIQSRHDNAASNGGNGIDFYINSGTGGATGSSAPGVGNMLVFSIVNGSGSPRVGVGIKNPTQALDVVGSINFSQELLVGGSAGTAGYVLQSNGASSPPSWVAASGGGGGWNLTGNSATTPGTNFIGTTDAKDFVTKTNSVERMRVTSAGNVGINTATPNASTGLDIQYGDNNSSSSGSNPASPVADIAFQYFSGGFRHFIASRHDGAASTGGNAIDFYICAGTGGASGSSAPGTGSIGAFTIENYNGTPRVGVGTIVRGTNYLTGPITDNSSVNGMFEVHAPTGNSDITLSTIDASTANVGGLIEFRGTGRGVTSGGNERLGQIENVYTGTSGLSSRMTFYTNNGTTYTRAMDISSQQYVGIGASSPNSPLQVNGSIAVAISTKTTNYTLTATDAIVTASGAVTITLPTAVGINGRQYTIKNIDPANTVTVATTPSQTIDGAATYTLSSQWKYVTLVSDGANWIIVANN